ncbi:hypothetical protein IC235_20600 [Hymenobacter sp. BT664]|uniref:Uncharacterized protein n=1 Tax=Hymenobacter montanus TaxID=2771359 RepID=A0A927BHS9_9BACT|nr:hypothetical protein [Hymenobacter montanus]MBD2770294.1 hypothetical protein [Hymenobacter montanus]
MADSFPDFYHQKTDAELLFLVAHPEHYQPSLIDEARRELGRRGVPLPAPASPAAPPAVDERAARTISPTLLIVAALLVVGLGIGYWVKGPNAPAPPAPLAAPRKGPPRLTEVVTSVVPNYDGVVAKVVEQQLRRVPAAERAAATQAHQPLHQYRELVKRFWAAETQTEYVLEEARKGQPNAALPGHVEAVGATWRQWNKATVYSYKFGPAMADHLDLMMRVAQQQQEGLADLLLVANNPQAYENDKTRRRAADVSDLLSGLLPKSPVTGRPYKPMVRHIRL